MLGRRRAIQGVRVPDAQLAGREPWSRRPLNLPERTAVNTVIQGSAADLIKLAMIAIARRLREERLAVEDAPADPRRTGLRRTRRTNSTPMIAELVTARNAIR